jgi:Fe-S-cluster containining protein
MKLPCPRSCHVCCSLPLFVVNVHPSEAPGLDVTYGANGTAYIRKRKNGACVYLTKKGCAIYEDRPEVCRGFTCERWLDEATNGHYNESMLQAVIYPLRNAARVLRSREKKSIARRFNALLST